MDVTLAQRALKDLFPTDRRESATRLLLDCARALRGAGDELVVCAGIAAVVAGVALVSLAAACITGGVALVAFGVGRIAFQTRGGSA